MSRIDCQKSIFFIMSLLLLITGRDVFGRRDYHKGDDFSYTNSTNQEDSITNVQENYYYNRIHTAKLEGSTVNGIYWVNLYVGSPPQQQSVIVDTGSYFLAFPCTSCGDNCGDHLDYQFSLEYSMTSDVLKCDQSFESFSCTKCNQEDNTCEWNTSYQEGSDLSGFIASDYVVFGEELKDYMEKFALDSLSAEEAKEYYKLIHHEQVRIPFGCTMDEPRQFFNQVPSGILGLAPVNNFQNNPIRLIDQIFAQHSQNGESLAFSLCFNARSGGYMSIGGYNHELHLPNAKTLIIPYVHPDYYEISLQEIKIGKQAISLKNHPTILDSGSTLIVGPSNLISPLIQEVILECKSGKTYKCGDSRKFGFEINQKIFAYEASEEFPTVNEFFDSFPVFYFDFGDGKVLELKAQSYLYFQSESNKRTLFKLGLVAAGNIQELMLGTPFFKNQDILFDQTNKQIHFTPSKCDLPQVNSTLMNIHSSKIQRTHNDEEYIADLIEFQKQYNLTTLYKNNTKMKESSNGDGKIEGEKKINPNLIPYKAPEKIQSQYIIFGFIILTLACLYYVWLSYCSRRSHGKQEVSPLQEMTGTPQQKSQLVTDEKDEQLASEETSVFGYVNNPILEDNLNLDQDDIEVPSRDPNDDDDND